MLTAEQMITLKAKVKAEMARRCDGTSLAAYAANTYDFTTVPTIGQPILAEHGQKTIDLLLQIKDHGDLTFVNGGQVLPASLDVALLNYVDALAAEQMTGGSTSCRGACTGLCFNSCGNSCSGCSGTCSGCSGSCNTSCGTGCASGAMR